MAGACASTVYDAFRILLLSVSSILNLSTSAYLRRTVTTIATDGGSYRSFIASLCLSVPLLGPKMRYQDWDVLLFPEGSKVPIQEFKTQCHVTRDLGETLPPLIISN